MKQRESSTERTGGGRRGASVASQGQGLGALSVPEHRHGLWYYFGGLILFLLAAMVTTGLLLAFYYQPSAAPASAPDGTPLVAARVTETTVWNGRQLEVGEIIPLPQNSVSGKAMDEGPLAGRVETLIDDATGRAVRPSAAWVSAEHTIMHDVDFGAVVRSVHIYTSHILIAAVIIHLISTFLMRSYRRRRRALWGSGLLLLLLLLGFAFTGSVLPWHRLAVAAAGIGSGLPASAVPGIGKSLSSLLRGGENVGVGTLTRMFALHAIAFPLGLLLLAWMHVRALLRTGLCAAKRQPKSGGAVTAGLVAGFALLMLGTGTVFAGWLNPASPLTAGAVALLACAGAYLLSRASGWLRAPQSMPSGIADTAAGASGVEGEQEAGRADDTSQMPETGSGRNETRATPGTGLIHRNAIAWLLALGCILSMAVASPWSRVGEGAIPADLTKPTLTPKAAHPEWYFMPAFELLRLLPGGATVAILLATLAFLFAVPWLDRRSGEERRAPALTATFLLLCAAAVALYIAGYLAVAPA